MLLDMLGFQGHTDEQLSFLCPLTTYTIHLIKCCPWTWVCIYEYELTLVLLLCLIRPVLTYVYPKYKHCHSGIPDCLYYDG